MIVIIGLRLLWVKGRALLRLLRPQPAHAPAHHAHDHHEHGHDHHHHDHVHDHGHAHQAHDHAHHDHDHEDEASAWGHAHAPEPSELGGRHWFRRALSAVIAVGLRPCSGAIIVLVFALAQGLFWIGVASTFAMGLGTAIPFNLLLASLTARIRRFQDALGAGLSRALDVLKKNM